MAKQYINKQLSLHLRFVLNKILNAIKIKTYRFYYLDHSIYLFKID
jgi:hypothetical protein